MIPYFPEPILHAGPVGITAFSATGVAAVVVSGWMILKRASQKKISTDEMFRMWFWMLASAAAGSIAHAWALHGRFGFTTLGACCGGIFGGLAWSLYHRLPPHDFMRRLDVMAYVFPLGWMIARLGCALAHDHRGIASESWIAVDFPKGPRLDLGLLEFLFLAGIVIVFKILDLRRRPDGFYFVTLAVAYSSCRLWLDTLSVEPGYLNAAVGFTLAAAGGAGARWAARRSAA
jgi:phosphatidylglycerol:prolipoprotein diacylglycerol transferase